VNSEADRGQKIVLGVIVVLLTISALEIVTSNLATGMENLLQQLGRFSLTVLLSLFLYRGAGWARWVAIVLASLAGVGWIVAVVALSPGPIAGFLLLVMGAVYLGCSVILLRNAAVNLHFAKGAVSTSQS